MTRVWTRRPAATDVTQLKLPEINRVLLSGPDG